MTNPKTSKRLTLLRELKAKKEAARQKMLDERFEDLADFHESEEQRFQRIMNDPSAWR